MAGPAESAVLNALTSDQAIDIHNAWKLRIVRTVSLLAAEYGVSANAIHDIRIRRSGSDDPLPGMNDTKANWRHSTVMLGQWFSKACNYLPTGVCCFEVKSFCK